MKGMAIVTALGAQIAATTVIGYFIGSKMDNWLHTEPVFLIIFVLLGVAAGFLAAIPMIKKFL